jgi:hypothetical protein
MEIRNRFSTHPGFLMPVHDGARIKLIAVWTRREVARGTTDIAVLSIDEARQLRALLGATLRAMGEPAE